MKWFKHDSSANRDDKLGKVLLKYGSDGYALYWLCLELIADRLDKDTADFELHHDSELLGSILRIDTLRVEEIMKYFLSLKLFETDGEIITCMKLAKRIEQSIVRNPRIRAIASEIVVDKHGQSSTVVDKPCKIRLDEIRLDKITSNGIGDKPHKQTFQIPTLEEVSAYCRERGNRVDPGRFIDFYESKGWLVGKVRMKSWQAAVRTWERNDCATDSPRVILDDDESKARRERKVAEMVASGRYTEAEARARLA